MPDKAQINTVMGFDFGTKRIGVAIGQTVTKTASPIGVVGYLQSTPNWQEIKKLIDNWQPDACVVGVPLTLDGKALHTTKLAQQFAQNLASQAGLRVFEFDERLSTKAAREDVFEQVGYKGLKKADIDAIAAVYILEHWLQSTAGG